MFFDYQAMEFRVFAYYVAAQRTIKDFTIIEEFKRGEDPYTNTARLILGRDPTPDERSTYKRAALSLLYNGSWRTILNQGLATSESGAQDIVDEIHRARPQIDKLTKCVQRIMLERGYVTTLWGRQLSGRTHTKEGRFIAPDRRPMVNQVIQGSSSEIMKDGMLNIADFLDKGLYDSHLVLTLHDENILDCSDSELPSIVENLPRLMSNERVAEYLPLSVDIEVARGSWANSRPWESNPDKYGDLPWETE